MIWILVLSFCGSTIATLMVVASTHRHGRWSADHDLTGPQKMHGHAVPRVGGIGLAVGMVCGAAALVAVQHNLLRAVALLTLCAVPTIAVGLAEDITKAVRPRWRLLAPALSGLLGAFLLKAILVRTGWNWLDASFVYPGIALVLTMFTSSGVVNSFNIIDGMNGLASMCSALMMAAIAYIALQVNDTLVGGLALAALGSSLGFFVWNYPRGLIFLGDGGAYFLGFYVAELAILLLHRNPAVSPMFPLLVCIYPVFETVFSIYRRRVLRQVPPSMPDGIHLHSLIYRRVMRWAVGNRSAKALTRRNSMTSPYLWLLCMLSVFPAVLFWDDTLVLSLSLLLFALSYLVLYWRIVRFKVPRWLVFRR